MGGTTSKDERGVAEALRSKERLNVQIFGNWGSGRTSLMDCAAGCGFTDREAASIRANSIRSIRVTYAPEDGKESVEVPVALWQICYASQREFPSSIERQLWCHALLYTYDITSRESFEGVKTWKSFTEKHKLPKAVVTVLVGCKLDLQDKRAVPVSEAQAYSEEIGCAFFIEVSSKLNLNVDDLLQGIVKRVLERNLFVPKAPAEDSKPE